MTDVSAQIIGKNKAAVEALLGKPVEVGYWTTTRPPEGANAAAVTAFEKESPDEIWVYTNGRVHFSLSDAALTVDDKSRFDLPPDNTLLV
ncbi:hypothetical protein C6I20_11125 [Aeromicrobium sp. A1-2]|nr:hypothetical protein C6I20_11125 [Aeromicrobium sp. A1-2]